MCLGLIKDLIFGRGECLFSNLFLQINLDWRCLRDGSALIRSHDLIWFCCCLLDADLVFLFLMFLMGCLIDTVVS